MATGQNAAKTQWYATWALPIGAPSFFSVRDRKLHSFLRKRVSSAYSMTAILKYEKPIQSLLDLLFQKLRKHVDAGNMIDMDEWTGAFAFDVVGTLGYGAPLGQLEAEADVMDIRSNVLDIFFWSICMGHYWGQMKLLQNRVTQTIFVLLGKRNGMQEFRNWSTERVKYRYHEKDNSTEHTDMLAHFINMKSPNGAPASIGEVLAEALNLV